MTQSDAKQAHKPPSSIFIVGPALSTSIHRASAGAGLVPEEVIPNFNSREHSDPIIAAPQALCPNHQVPKSTELASKMYFWWRLANTAVDLPLVSLSASVIGWRRNLKTSRVHLARCSSGVCQLQANQCPTGLLCCNSFTPVSVVHSSIGFKILPL